MPAQYIKGKTENDAIRSFLDLIIKKRNITPSLDLIMEEIGKFYEADRSYIFEKDETNTYMSNTLEWCGEGIEPEIENLQGIPLHLAKPWFDEFRAKGSFYLSCNEDYATSDPLIYEYLQPQGIDALLAVPLVIDGDIVGFLGVDNPRRHCDYHLLLSVMATYTHNIIFRMREIAEHEAMHEKQIHEERMRVAFEAAQKANLAKTNFLFSMSHDIRTPMNAIMGYNKLIKRDIADTAKVLRYQQKIELASDFLLALINNILDMARIESGKMQLEEITNITGGLIKQIMDVLRTEANKKAIKLIYVNKINPKSIAFDCAKVSEVFSNLISNAIKYTPDGGYVKVTTSELPAEQQGYMIIKTEVEDNGIGMSEDFLQRIFEPFEREHNAATSNIPGTGLGMSIVKKLVDFMQGSIEVTSKLGVGSKITVCLPHKIIDQTDCKAVQKHEDQETHQQKVLQGKHVLLAEDNELNAEIAIELLKLEGITIDVAVNGAVCLEKFKAKAAGSYDLILMDIQMPVLNGYETTKAIRQLSDPAKAAIPIVAMTASAFSEDKKLALEAGMNGFCTKPIDIGLLKQEIARVLK